MSDFTKLQRAYLIQFLSTPLPAILRALLLYCYKVIIRIATRKYLDLIRKPFNFKIKNDLDCHISLVLKYYIKQLQSRED